MHKESDAFLLSIRALRRADRRLNAIKAKKVMTRVGEIHDYIHHNVHTFFPSDDTIAARQYVMGEIPLDEVVREICDSDESDWQSDPAYYWVLALIAGKPESIRQILES